MLQLGERARPGIREWLSTTSTESMLLIAVVLAGAVLPDHHDLHVVLNRTN